jgi:hypothetical protein
MSNMYAASSEWNKRPADERFWTLAEMRGACAAERVASREKKVPFALISAVKVDGGIGIVGGEGNPVRMNHHAFGQLATTVGAPGGYLRGLDRSTAVDCLNQGLAPLKARGDVSDRSILFSVAARPVVRAFQSESYEREWNDDVCRYLEQLGGWRPPAGLAVGDDPRHRPATAEDILPGQINIGPGSMIGPAGLYASDHDMFAFLVAPDRPIDDGTGKPLMRGIFVRNSEVGECSLTFSFFLMQAVCGNHIVWSPKDVHEIKIRHVGKEPLGRAVKGFEATLARYRDSAPEEERMIAAARKLVLGNTRDEVLAAVIKYARTHSIKVSERALKKAYEVAEEHVSWYGQPNTVWGVVAGLTHASQAGGQADKRDSSDREAAKLLQMVDF